MSQREYAVNLINGLPDEKLNALIVFIQAFTGAQAEEQTEQEELERKRKAFEELNAMIKPINIGDNDKEILQRHREEKYGS